MTQEIISTWTQGCRCSLVHLLVHPDILDHLDLIGVLPLNISSQTMVLMSTTDQMVPQDSSDKTLVPLQANLDHPAPSLNKQVLLVRCPQALSDSLMVMFAHLTQALLLHLETSPFHLPLTQNLLPPNPLLLSLPLLTALNPHPLTPKPSPLVYLMNNSEQLCKWSSQLETQG